MPLFLKIPFITDSAAHMWFAQAQGAGVLPKEAHLEVEDGDIIVTEDVT